MIPKIFKTNLKLIKQTCISISPHAHVIRHVYVTQLNAQFFKHTLLMCFKKIFYMCVYFCVEKPIPEVTFL